MKSPVGQWGLTPGEKRALLFLCTALLIGTGYRWYQWRAGTPVASITAQDSAAVARIREAYFKSANLPDSAIIQSKSGDDPSPELTDGVPFNLNTADQMTLETLPGIGPVLARRIIELRAEKGGFKTVTELLKVRGIGQKRLDDIKPLVFCDSTDAKP